MHIGGDMFREIFFWFTEYLNYYGGWGKTFGNITGGGVYDSKTNCNPTPYEPCIWQELQ